MQVVVDECFNRTLRDQGRASKELRYVCQAVFREFDTLTPIISWYAKYYQRCINSGATTAEAEVPLDPSLCEWLDGVRFRMEKIMKAIDSNPRYLDPLAGRIENLAGFEKNIDEFLPIMQV